MLQAAQFLIILVVPALMIFAAAYDLLTMTIPNRISLALLATFVASSVLLGFSWTEIAMHFAAGMLILAVGLGLFAAGWVGGGDVKLAAATTLLLGFGQTLEYLMVSALAGGALTLLILLLRRIPIPDFALRMIWLKRLYDPNNGVPYGIALAFGAMVVFPRSALWVAAFPG